MKIAVVGSGISGLSAAYYLSKKHHVDLFEKEDHFGGHSHTIDLIFDEKRVSVDIGFIVFNFQTYPNLINFFKENDVQIEKSDMSFSVSVENTNFEYCGKGLNGIFSNRSNLFNPNFLKMFFDIIKFYKNSDQINVRDQKLTLGEYLENNKLSKHFEPNSKNKKNNKCCICKCAHSDKLIKLIPKEQKNHPLVCEFVQCQCTWCGPNHQCTTQVDPITKLLWPHRILCGNCRIAHNTVA